jgi:hypothetical protein
LKKVLVEFDYYLWRDLKELLDLAIDGEAELKYCRTTAHLDNHQWWGNSGLSDPYRIQVDMVEVRDALAKAV